MHIVDGALSAEVVVGGAVLAVAGVGLGLKRLRVENLPAAGVLSAAFFAASLVRVPLGPSSIHLIANGLAGLVLGWAAFPALLAALLLQAVFFGFGGLSVLGVNTLVVALPAIAVYYICRRGIMASSPVTAAIWGGVGGGLAIALTALAVALALALTGEQFLPVARVIFFAHIPVMGIEAALTGAAVYLARQVKPELFKAVTQSSEKS